MFSFIKMYWRLKTAEPGCEDALFVELNGLKWQMGGGKSGEWGSGGGGAGGVQRAVCPWRSYE